MRKANRKTILSLLPLILIGVFLVIHPASAAANWALNVMGGFLSIIISAVGLILILIIKGLMLIASYQHFIDSQAVVQGWVIVRDVCNMFFVVVLLIISFGTILHLENYNYKKWLPKLILMAVLINFSKTICGILIDVAQVVMLSFVNAFKDVGAANLLDILGVEKILKFAKEGDYKGEFWIVIGAYILGLLYVIIAAVVCAAMAAMLAMRLVMIWIYVILSPLAYIMSAFPGGQKYSSMWWKQFTENLIVGPILAFFIWLSFAALQTTGTITGTDNTATNQEIGYYVGQQNASSTAVLGTQSSTPEALINFIVAIGMLIGGMKIAQEAGGAAGSLAGKVSAGGFKFAKKWGGKIAMGDNYVARKFTKAVGFDLRPLAIKAAVEGSFKKTRMEDEQAIRDQGEKNLTRGGVRGVVGGAGAGTDWAENYVTGFLGMKGIGRAIKEVSQYNPRQRKKVKQEIDAKEEEVNQAKNKMDSSISSSQMKEEQDKKDAINKQLASQQTKLLSAEIRLEQQRAGSPEYEKAKDEVTKLRADIAVNEKEIEKWDKKMAGRTEVSDDDYKGMQDNLASKKNDVGNLKEKLARVSAPLALEGRGEYRKMINESSSKIKDVTNAVELMKFYDDAKRRGNKYDQTAILEKLSHDANLNEILNEKGYAANSKGLYKFLHNMENDFGEKRGVTGFDENEILRLQNDLGESEERVGHWEMSKMVTMNNKGELISTVRPKTINSQGKETDWKGQGQVTRWDDSDHVIEASSEIAKMDPQKILTSLNRLAVGGENGSGNFELSNLGRVLIKMLDEAGTFVAQEKRLQNNLARNLNQPHIKDELKVLLEISDADADKSSNTLGVIKNRASGGPAEILAQINRSKNNPSSTTA